MTSIFIGLMAVLLFNVYALLLIVLRSRVYGVPVYRPMLLNVRLSLVPVVLSLALVLGSVVISTGLIVLDAIGAARVLLWVYLILTAGVWLLSLPNAAYLITELNMSHRSKRDGVPLWFDIVQTLTLALSGIVNSVVSLAVIHVVLWSFIDDDAPVPPAGSWVFAFLILFLGTVGIYLGRYLRFNSWDIRHPSSMFRKLRAYAAVPGHPADFFGFTSTHTVLLALIYTPLFTLGASVIS